MQRPSLKGLSLFQDQQRRKSQGKDSQGGRRKAGGRQEEGLISDLCCPNGGTNEQLFRIYQQSLLIRELSQLRPNVLVLQKTSDLNLGSYAGQTAQTNTEVSYSD